MKHRAIFVVFAFAAVAGSLSACSSEHPGSETLVPLSEVDAFEKHTYSHDSDTDTSEIDPTLTVQSAKERARAVENELVAFVPAEGQGLSGGGTILDGKYHIAAAVGPKTGKYRVEIRWAKPTGKQYRSETGEMLEVTAEGLPEKYNNKSELTADLKPGKNTVNFDLPR